MNNAGTDTGDDGCFAVATKTLAQKPSELAVTERDVAHAALGLHSYLGS
jgi:hypothetical protein